MKSRAVASLVAALAAVGCLGVAAWAGASQEEEITLDQAPAAVQAAILKEAAGAKITEIEKETKDGKTVYEAEFVRDGKEIEITIAPDGTVLGREAEDEGDDEDDGDDDDLDMSQVPEPARAALMKLAGGAKITEVEREKEHGAVVYEAEWMANGVEHEAAVTAEGALVELEEVIAVADAPSAVRDVIAKQFGAGTKVVVEKKMVVLYEIESKVDGKEKEVLVLPTGRVINDSDDDDHHGDDNDDGDDD